MKGRYHVLIRKKGRREAEMAQILVYNVVGGMGEDKDIDVHHIILVFHITRFPRVYREI